MSDLPETLGGVPFLSKLEHFITGAPVDGSFFVPKAETDLQRQVLENLRLALLQFEREFGSMALENQLTVALSAAQIARKRRAIDARILQARADINAEAEDLRLVGDEAGATAAQLAATPDYPERVQDDAWLKKWCGYGVR